MAWTSCQLLYMQSLHMAKQESTPSLAQRFTHHEPAPVVAVLEEGHLHACRIQHVEDGLRVDVGPIVKGDGDRARDAALVDHGAGGDRDSRQRR